MGHGMTVHDRQEADGERKGALSLDHSREAASIALANKPAFDVALMAEEDFTKGLERIKVRQVRMQRIIDTILVPGVHYLQEDAKGNKIFDKPHLTIAGAAELRSFFRFTCRPVAPPEIQASKEFVAVTVTVGCFDSMDRLIGSRSGACNTMEKRFQKRGGGWIYADAREMAHQCTTMAEKRAASLITKEVTGAVAFFAAEEEMDKALASDESAAQAEPEPATKEEMDKLYAAARKADIKNAEAFKEFVQGRLGRGFIGKGEDVELLLKELDAKRAAARPTVKDGAKGYGEDPPAQRSAEDEAIDRELGAGD